MSYKIILFFLILIISTSLPIWTVDYFINQDGIAHAYNSYLMLELIKGNPLITDFFAFNSISIPNSSGHWLMVFLLNFFSPYTVTKLMQILTFAGIVAAAGWLRWQTNGRDGLITSLLLGAVVAFNWLWFMGFYNFMIGVIGFIFTLGLYISWRDDLNATRTFILALLILLVYFSHLVSFGILAVSLIFLALFTSKENLKNTLFWTLLAFLPVIPLVILYKILSESGGGIYPYWRSLENPFSLKDWVNQIRVVDPFVIISRRRFPFSQEVSSLFAVFAPIIWILFALFCLSLPSVISRVKNYRISKEKLPFLILFAGFIFIALFAPDDFGYSHGSILRERVFICALIFFIPLFNLKKYIFLKRLAQGVLVGVLIFQTAAVWDYALRADNQVKEFLSAREHLGETRSIASVVMMDDVFHFHSSPVINLNCFIGINKDVIVWDNYEIGYYIFPVIAKNESDRRFIRKLTESNGFGLNNPAENFAEKIAKLDSALEENHYKVDTILVWGSDSRVDQVLAKWFQSEPFFENGQVRLFRHK